MQHETLDPQRLRTRDLYRLMTDLVAPRPIGWVSTQGSDGRRNLAPYSYFQALGSSPPTVVLGCGWRSDGRPKDTLRNILDTREFTVSHVSDELAEAMNLTSADLGPGQSEWDYAAAQTRLTSAPAQKVGPPRVAEARASMECRLVHALPRGEGPAGNPSFTIVIGEVVCFTVAEGLVSRDAAGHLESIDPAQLASVGRLGGIAYTRADGGFTMPRPKP